MSVTVFPVDAVAGAPSYSGRQLRQMLAVLTGGGTGGRPLIGRSGVNPRTPASTVTASSSTWTVLPHGGYVDAETSAASGGYFYAIDANVAGSMAAADASNPRIDLISVQVSDPAESDGSTTPSAAVVYTAGTAAASPTPPAKPARSITLAQINVPAAGGGSPSVTWVARSMIAAGGIAPVSGSSAYPSAPYVGQYIDDAALGLLRWNGASWDGGDTGWQPMTVLTAGGAGGTGSDAPMVRRIGDMVFWRGQIIKGGGWPSGGYVSIATLPSTLFAPVADSRFQMAGFTSASFDGNILRTFAGSTDIQVGAVGDPAGTLYLGCVSYMAA